MRTDALARRRARERPLTMAADRDVTARPPSRRQVHVSSTQYAVDTAGATVIHVRSLARVMSLMGPRVDAATGFSHLDRGYQSESVANTTLDVPSAQSNRACPAPSS